MHRKYHARVAITAVCKALYIIVQRYLIGFTFDLYECDLANCHVFYV